SSSVRNPFATAAPAWSPGSLAIDTDAETSVVPNGGIDVSIYSAIRPVPWPAFAPSQGLPPLRAAQPESQRRALAVTNQQRGAIAPAYRSHSGTAEFHSQPAVQPPPDAPSTSTPPRKPLTAQGVSRTSSSVAYAGISVPASSGGARRPLLPDIE